MGNCIHMGLLPCGFLLSCNKVSIWKKWLGDNGTMIIVNRKNFWYVRSLSFYSFIHSSFLPRTLELKGNNYFCNVRLPVLTGAAGALGAAYCSPYLAVDGAYHTRPVGQTSATGSSSKENSTNKPTNEWKPSQRPESGTDEFAPQQNKPQPQPRRYSAMNLANDVLR